MKIIVHPNPVLRQKAQDIEVFDEELKKYADKFTQTMLKYDGVGLAGPQVGLSKKIIAINIEKKDLEGLSLPMPMVLINSHIIQASFDTNEANEACLSVPGKIAPVWRAEEIIVNAKDVSGKDIHLECGGWLARVLQHEIDHLNGILFIDRVKDKSTIKEYDPKDTK
ncbi:MAG TPA: peptide deformylase [bacterium]|nr:peptide deformylase [bacterium]